MAGWGCIAGRSVSGLVVAGLRSINQIGGCTLRRLWWCVNVAIGFLVLLSFTAFGRMDGTCPPRPPHCRADFLVNVAKAGLAVSLLRSINHVFVIRIYGERVEEVAVTNPSTPQIWL
jgi:hypothetical protein